MDLVARIQMPIGMIKFVSMEVLDNTTTHSGVMEKPPVGFTSSALEELKRLYNSLELREESALRIGVKGGGCSGMSYMLAFDKPEESDNKYEIEGIPVVMNKAHVMYVLGMEVDWENGLDNRGFSFNNPNASSTCGCGQSFAV
jgi:iron-sulfur cluster assembly protein